MPSQANCALPQGFQLDQYRIERQLSLGGFSIVYLFLLFAVLLVENGLGLMWALPKVIG